MDPAMVKNLALGAVPPGVLALLFFLLAWRRRPAERAGPALVATPIFMALAVVFTYAITFQTPRLAPLAAFDWLPIIAIAAGVAGVFAALERLPLVVRWTPAVLALLFAAWAGAKNAIATSWTPSQTGAHLLEAVVFGIVLLGAGHSLVSRRAGVMPVASLMLFAGAACQLLVLGFFSMKVGQVAGMGASMAIAALPVARWRPATRVGPGGMVFIVVMTLAALGQGRLYGQATPEFARIYTALLTLSLVGGALVAAGLGERCSARIRTTLVLGVVALPLVAGLGIAGKKWQDEQRQQGSEPDPYAVTTE
jgi:hypothetical protein